MFNIYRKEMNWGGRRLVLETGKIARQADAAVMVTYGETTVLCTVVAEKTPKPGPSISCRSPFTTKKKLSPPVKIPGGFFNAKGARPKRKS